MTKIKGMKVDTLKVHEYDVFSLRPLADRIDEFNDFYETVCGLSLLCSGGGGPAGGGAAGGGAAGGGAAGMAMGAGGGAAGMAMGAETL